MRGRGRPTGTTARGQSISAISAGQGEIIAPGELHQRPLYDLMVGVANCALMRGWALIGEEKPHERDLF